MANSSAAAPFSLLRATSRQGLRGSLGTEGLSWRLGTTSSPWAPRLSLEGVELVATCHLYSGLVQAVCCGKAPSFRRAAAEDGSKRPSHPRETGGVASGLMLDFVTDL